MAWHNTGVGKQKIKRTTEKGFRMERKIGA